MKKMERKVKKYVKDKKKQKKLMRNFAVSEAESKEYDEKAQRYADGNFSELCRRALDSYQGS